MIPESSLMESRVWLDRFPLWGLFLLTAVLVLVSVRLGVFLGGRRRRRAEHETDTSLGTVIGATLGLLAFMLAFTFGLAAERLQIRKQLLLDEVNAIGTTYLRAALLREPHRSAIRKLLSEYVEIRARLAREDLSRRAQRLRAAISRSEALQNEMWSHVVAIADADRSSEIDALFIDSLNQMIDLHTSRVTVARYRIPPTLWNVLYAIIVLSMVTVGYQAGMSGKESLTIGLVLALTFSTVVYLITDLDRVTQGNLRVNQQPMLDLHQTIQTQQEREQTPVSNLPPGAPPAQAPSAILPRHILTTIHATTTT